MPGAPIVVSDRSVRSKARLFRSFLLVRKLPPTVPSSKLVRSDGLPKWPVLQHEHPRIRWVYIDGRRPITTSDDSW